MIKQSDSTKRVLIVNASPRTGGSVERLLEAFIDGLDDDIDIVRINIALSHVAPCTGCMVCRTKKECVLPIDDAYRILSLFRKADAVVIGTPCYWGNIPGTLKVLFDRIVYGLMEEPARGFPIGLHKGKKAIIIATCNTPWPWNRLFRQSSGTIRALKEIIGWSGFRIAATMQRGGTRNSPVTEKDLDKARRLARKI